MLFCYVDESGTPDIPGNTSHYVLAGFAIPVSKWKYCENQISRIKRKYDLENAEIHTGWILWPYLEQAKIPHFDQLDKASRIYEIRKYRNTELLRLQTLKSSKLYHKTKKNYRHTDPYIHLTFQERQRFIEEIASEISGWSFSRLFAECIDKIHFNPAVTKLSVDEQAFEQIVSRFEQYLTIFSKSSHQKQFGLLVHDNNDTVKKKHTELMKAFHRNGTFWTRISHIIETPMFVDSQLTSMVQLADVCGFAIRRYLEKGESHLFSLIFRVADTKSGKVVGIRHFTTNGCTCLICQAHR